MKPSDIILSTPPLTSCFKKTEAECAAALLVWYLQSHGDEWKPVTASLLGSALETDGDKEPVASWRRNPFLSPDFRRLSKDGFITPIDGSFDQPLSFTELGLERLRKSLWNRGNL